MFDLWIFFYVYSTYCYICYIEWIGKEIASHCIKQFIISRKYCYNILNEICSLHFHLLYILHLFYFNSFSDVQYCINDKMELKAAHARERCFIVLICIVLFKHQWYSIVETPVVFYCSNPSGILLCKHKWYCVQTPVVFYCTNMSVILLFKHQWYSIVQTPVVFYCSNTSGILLFKHQWYSIVQTPVVFYCANTSGILLFKHQWYSIVQTPVVFYCANTSGILLFKQQWHCLFKHQKYCLSKH